MQPYLLPLISVAITPFFVASELSSQSGILRVERSPMRMRASGASYDGVTQGSMTAKELEAARKRDYWVEDGSDGVVFFPAHLMSWKTEGLGAYRIGAEVWDSYPMFGLAIAAGWYVPTASEKSFPSHIHGITVGAGRVWMGTAGLGIVAWDLRDRTWSRYDVKAGVLPGVHSTVFYVDDEYLFAYSGGPTGGWQQQLPDVPEGDFGPALEVYSIRRNTWLRVRGIPRENVIAFGWTRSLTVSMMCDTRHYARTAVMPVDELCTAPKHVEAAPAAGGYVLGREFTEPGAPLRYTIRKDQLAAAFDSLR